MSEPFQPIRISFEIDDSYLLDSIRSNPVRQSHRWKIFLFIAPFAVAGVTFVILSAYRRDRQLFIPACFLLAVVGIMLFRSSPTGQLREERKRLREIFHQYPIDHKIEFGPNGFIVLGADGASNFHPWSSVLRVVKQPPGIALVIQGNLYYWVPAGAFSNSGDYQRATELI